MYKLVVVDDHEALREGLVSLLSQSGIDIVGTAGSAPAAVDAVAHSQPDVALVSTALPGGSAFGLTRELLDGNPGLAVMLYSDDADAQALHDGLDAGALGYALKRGSLGELIEAVERVAQGGSYIDPRIEQQAAPEGSEPRSTLSPREREVLTLIAEGMTAEAVGERLGVSVETVRTHTRNAIRKLGARNRMHAVALALVSGEIEFQPG